MTSLLTRALTLAAAFLVLVRPASGEDTPRVELEIVEDGCWARQGGQPLLFYQSTPKSLDGKHRRANYVHPLYDLDGHVLTEDFPKDHLHHRGIFWAWHQIYIGDRAMGDPWIAKGFLSRVNRLLAEEHEDGSASLTVQASWESPQLTNKAGEPEPFVRESTCIRVHPRATSHGAVDFHIRLRALKEDVRIGGSNDDKGYGGFSARIRLPQDLVFTGRTGPVEPQRTAVAAGPWIDLSGAFRPDSTSGMAILSHSSLPGFPQPWILRRQRSMQNAAYPGRERVKLSTTRDLEFRYRIVVHQGRAEPQKIEQWLKAYERETTKR